MSKTYYMQDCAGAVFITSNPEYHKDSATLPAAKGKAAYRLQCIEKVKSMLEGVDTVYSIIRRVSVSGMSLDIDLYIIKDNRLVYLTGYASRILNYPMSRNRGLVAKGCDVDMVFHCVSTLAKYCQIDYKNLKSEII